MKFPEIGTSDGDPQFDQIVIRGIPHREEVIRDMEKSVGGQIITDEIELFGLDKIMGAYISQNGHIPEMIEDTQTHRRYIPVRCELEGGEPFVPIVTFIYFHIPIRMVIPNEVLDSGRGQ
jgi:hypothetical protein